MIQSKTPVVKNDRGIGTTSGHRHAAEWHLRKGGDEKDICGATGIELINER